MTCGFPRCRYTGRPVVEWTKGSHSSIQQMTITGCILRGNGGVVQVRWWLGV